MGYILNFVCPSCVTCVNCTASVSMLLRVLVIQTVLLNAVFKRKMSVQNRCAFMSWFISLLSSNKVLYGANCVVF